MRYLVLICVVLLTNGCASAFYSKVETGELHGKLNVEWIGYDKFRFVPDKDDPLVFVRANKEPIYPGEMYTNGGSIPRPMRAFKHYSPWGYAPAFVIHDWLFHMQQCKLPGHEEFNLKEAAQVMSEVIKTQMEDPKHGDKSEFVVYSMYKAVISAEAAKQWQNGKCDMGPASTYSIKRITKPVIINAISFD